MPSNPIVMILEKILDQLNSFEKNSFLKIVNNIIESTPKNAKEIEKILVDTDKDLKNVDNINIVKVFNVIEDEYTNCIKSEFIEATSQLDILVDILIRDGNCLMSRDWFNTLYENEIRTLKAKIKEFEIEIDSEKSEIDERRKRDYKIYRACLHTAYYNDQINNLDPKITSDEQSILLTLSKMVGLSHEEVKLINYMILGIEKQEIDNLINELKNLGIIFYSKKNLKIFVADEMVRILRNIRGRALADKYRRRVLKQLRESQINQIAKNHNINWRNPLQAKIKSIIKEGIHFDDILINDIHKENAKVSEKKSTLNELIEKGLRIDHIKGVTLEEKVNHLIEYFNDVDRDDKVTISLDGYDKLLNDLDSNLPDLKNIVKTEFELQEDKIFQSNYLLDYNIKPRDILDLVPEKQLKEYCEKLTIKTRGHIINNILENYKDVENLYIENYTHIAYRDLNQLKSNGINIKEADIGVKFENITKNIFIKLGFNVDEKLRKKLSTSRDKMDIILNLANNELILIECKTVKDSGYNKFSSVSRQLKSYINLAQSDDYRVIKSLLIAPEFSEDFEKECREEFELNLSLISAQTLLNIYEGFKKSRLKQFPYKLLMKDVLISEEWILKAIAK